MRHLLVVVLLVVVCCDRFPTGPASTTLRVQATIPGDAFTKVEIAARAGGVAKGSFWSTTRSAKDNTHFSYDAPTDFQEFSGSGIEFLLGGDQAGAVVFIKAHRSNGTVVYGRWGVPDVAAGFDIDLSAVREIRGIVHDEQGGVVANAHVLTGPPSNYRDSEFMQANRMSATDREGRFGFGLFGDEKFPLSVFASGAGFAWVDPEELDRAGSDLVLTTCHGQSLHGVLTGPYPVEGAIVGFDSLGPDGEFRYRIPTVANARGEYDFPQLPCGVGRLVVMLETQPVPPYTSVELNREVEVVSDGTKQSNIAFQGADSHVTISPLIDGGPPKSVWYFARVVSPTTGESILTSGNAQDSTDLTIDAFRGGVFRASLIIEDKTGERYAEWIDQEGLNTQDIEISVDTHSYMASISGSIENASQYVVSEIQLCRGAITDFKDAQGRWADVPNSVVIVDDGTFLIEHLKPGEYTVFVMAHPPGRPNWLQWGSTTVQVGGTGTTCAVRIDQE